MGYRSGALWPSQFPRGSASRRFPPYFMVPSWALSSPRVGRRKPVAANGIRHRSLMTLAPNAPCNSGQSKVHGSQEIIHSDSFGNQALHTAQCLSNSTLHPEPSSLQKCAQRIVEQPQFTGKRSNFAGACSLVNSLHSLDSYPPTFPFRKAIGTSMPPQASAAYMQGVRRGTSLLGWVPLILRRHRVGCSQWPMAGTLGPLSSTPPTTEFTANRK